MAEEASWMARLAADKTYGGVFCLQTGKMFVIKCPKDCEYRIANYQIKNN